MFSWNSKNSFLEFKCHLKILRRSFLKLIRCTKESCTIRTGSNGIFDKGLSRDDEVYLKRSNLHSCQNVAGWVADLSFKLLTKICGSTPERWQVGSSLLPWKTRLKKYLLGYIFQYLNQARKLRDLIGNENPCRTTIQRWTDPLYRYMVLRTLKSEAWSILQVYAGLVPSCWPSAKIKYDLRFEIMMIIISRVISKSVLFSRGMIIFSIW